MDATTVRLVLLVFVLAVGWALLAGWDEERRRRPFLGFWRYLWEQLRDGADRGDDVPALRDFRAHYEARARAEKADGQ